MPIATPEVYAEMLDRAKAATGLDNFGDQGFREGLGPPGIPVDWVTRVLKKVGAGFVLKPIGFARSRCSGHGPTLTRCLRDGQRGWIGFLAEKKDWLASPRGEASQS